MTAAAGREMDAVVAEKVMGWHKRVDFGYSPPQAEWHEVVDGYAHWVAYVNTPGQIEGLPLFCPSTDIAAAMLVVEKMRADDWCYQIAETDAGSVVCWFFRGGVAKGRIPGMTPPGAPITPYHRGTAPTVSLAIVRAALSSQGGTDQ